MPHALLFAGVGAAAAELVERGYITSDFNQISLLCGLVMSLLLTFRLTFSFNRYEEAISTVSSLQGCCRRLTSRLCASLDANDDASHQTIIDSRRRLVLVFLLCKVRVRGGEGHSLSELERIGLLTAAERTLLERPLLHGLEGSEEAGDRFPSKARVALVVHWMWRDLSALMRSGAIHEYQYSQIDADLGQLSAASNHLDASP